MKSREGKRGGGRREEEKLKGAYSLRNRELLIT
jgi:hypothetical protein